MPSPSKVLATLRPDLGGSVEEFDLEMNAQGFIGTKVFPAIESQVQSGSFGIIKLKSLLQHPETRRAPSAGYNRSKYEFEDGSFATKENGIEEPVDDREAKIYANYFDAEKMAYIRARAIVMNAMERRIADLVFNTSTFTNAAVAAAWTIANAATATPLTDVEARVKAMWALTGLWPNALIMNRNQFRNLRFIAQIIDKVKQVRSVLPGDINVNDLSAAFDLPYILVAGGAKNAANEGQNVSVASIWSDSYCAVARIATTNDIKEPCLGRTIHWGEDGSEIGGAVESYEEVQSRSTIIRARMDTDEKLILTQCCQLLTGVIA